MTNRRYNENNLSWAILDIRVLLCERERYSNPHLPVSRITWHWYRRHTEPRRQSGQKITPPGDMVGTTWCAAQGARPCTARKNGVVIICGTTGDGTDSISGHPANRYTRCGVEWWVPHHSCQFLGLSLRPQIFCLNINSCNPKFPRFLVIWHYFPIKISSRYFGFRTPASQNSPNFLHFNNFNSILWEYYWNEASRYFHRPKYREI